MTWNRECLFDDDCNNNKYDDVEEGKGSCGGADDGGESDNDGRDVVRGPFFGSMGHRTLIVGPHPVAAVCSRPSGQPQEVKQEQRSLQS
jgi:hypothetical protein